MSRRTVYILLIIVGSALLAIAGLGLWISRQLAQSLGGNITCTSHIGEGSSFEVRIGVGSGEQHSLIYQPIDGHESLMPSSTHSNAPIPSLCGRILLAEDSPDIQKLVQLLVQRTGAQIITVDNGKKALEFALGDDFDLILMDMQMPEMSGMEATHWLRNAGYSGPIVALTANAMKEDKEQGQAAGFDGYLTKPIVTEQFYDALSQHLPAKEQENFAVLNPVAIVSNDASPSSPAPDDLRDDPDYQELVELFSEGLKQYVQEISDALKNRNWELLQSVSHKLKGSGSAFGFPLITEVAGNINRTIHLNPIDFPDSVFLEEVVSLKSYCESIIQQQKKK